MSPDEEEMRQYFSEFTMVRPANLLVMPNLDARNAAYNVVARHDRWRRWRRPILMGWRNRHTF